MTAEQDRATAQELAATLFAMRVFRDYEAQAVPAIAAAIAAARAEGHAAGLEDAARVAARYRNTYGGPNADYYAGMDAAAAAIEDEIHALTVQV